MIYLQRLTAVVGYNCMFVIFFVIPGFQSDFDIHLLFTEQSKHLRFSFDRKAEFLLLKSTIYRMKRLQTA